MFVGVVCQKGYLCFDLLELLSELNCEKGYILVVVLYDFNQVCCYVSYLIVLWEGKIVVQGVLKEIVIVELIECIYGLCCMIIDDLVVGMLFVVLFG